MQTIDKVFQRHLIPKGEFDFKGHLVKPAAITKTRVLCVEGERDDISGIGQTKAALDVCTSLPSDMKQYHLQEKVGHYGIFNGRRYLEEIVPVILNHIRLASARKAA